MGSCACPCTMVVCVSQGEPRRYLYLHHVSVIPLVLAEACAKYPLALQCCSGQGLLSYSVLPNYPVTSFDLRISISLTTRSSILRLLSGVPA
jgi:hypothetical protein